MQFKTMNDFNFKGKKVLLRADLNVPMQDGKVSDTTRIDRVRPTIDFLVKAGAKIIILAHFGRPKGETNPEFSLGFLPEVLKVQWEQKVEFAEDCIGEAASAAIDELSNGKILLLENVRFHKGEEANDPAFAKELAALGDIYVNDAFSAAHRAHASTEGLAHLMPSCAGALMEAELNALKNALEDPKRPVMAIVGGAKVSTKITLLNNLVEKMNFLVLGGGMANTFFHAMGVPVGKSLCEKELANEAKSIMKAATRARCKIILPVDRIAVREFGENVPHEVIAKDGITDQQEAVDIGPETIRMLRETLNTCKTVLWNGPMGVFEVKPFDNGTNSLAKAVADLTAAGKIISVAGGGDTVAALENAGVADKFTYVSTAGGAFLEWLEGKTLPGVAALSACKDAA